MTKSCKVAILLAFLNFGKLKSSLNENGIYESFKESYKICSNYIDITQHKSSFIKQFKDVIDYRTREYYKERLENKNLEELVDIFEVLVGLAGSLGYTEEELFENRREKLCERSGFGEGWFWKWFGISRL